MSDKKQVLVCGGVDCKEKRSLEVHQALKAGLADAPDIEVTVYSCFGECTSGPNVVIYPDKIWYNPVTLNDVQDVARCLRSGTVCDRLTGNVGEVLSDLVFDLLDSGIAGTADISQSGG